MGQTSSFDKERDTTKSMEGKHCGRDSQAFQRRIAAGRFREVPYGSACGAGKGSVWRIFRSCVPFSLHQLRRIFT